MSRTVFLDAGPLSLITNPKSTPDSLAATQWVIAMRAAGYHFMVPSIADYEVRRELIRAGKTRSILQLDAFNAAAPGWASAKRSISASRLRAQQCEIHVAHGSHRCDT